MAAGFLPCLETCCTDCTVTGVMHCTGYFAVQVRQRKERNSSASRCKKGYIKVYFETLWSERYCVYILAL